MALKQFLTMSHNLWISLIFQKRQELIEDGRKDKLIYKDNQFQYH